MGRGSIDLIRVWLWVNSPPVTFRQGKNSASLAICQLETM